MSVFAAAIWGGMAAISLVMGAFLAMRFQLSNVITGAVMGFGSGALISSIAYELVPESTIVRGGGGMALAFALGALTFFGSDWAVDRMGGKQRKSIAGKQQNGSGTAIFLGTLLDGIPESLILGIGLATGGAISVAFLMAVFVSNVPEGIAGTKSLLSVGHSKRKVLSMWTWLVIASAVASGLGFALVKSFPAVDGHYAQAFAAGAVLTMLADVMMPEAFEHGGKCVGLLATLGFLIAAILSVAE
ncbi:MAG: ZIP family zinc transporter [Gammaproteobacteria bacterium]